MSNFVKQVGKHIEVKDLPEPLQNLAITFDIESVRKMIVQYPNERIYVPNIKSFRNAIKKAIREELEVKCYLDLRAMSYELGCTVDHLRKIVKEVKEEEAELSE